MQNKMPQTKKEVVNILKNLGVDLFNYEVHDDLSISIDGDVNLTHKNLITLPVNFNEIRGVFNCSYNNLVSLKGAPKKVTHTFMAMKNKISFLKDLPQCPEICLSYNNIKILDNIPEETIDLDLSYNDIQNISPELLQKNNYKLESLILSYNKINSGLDNLMNFSRMDRIYINENKITSIDAFKHFPKLRILCVRSNKIEKIIWNELFSENIKYINVADNKITEISVDPKIELDKLCVYGNLLEKIEVHPNAIIGINYSHKPLADQIDFHQKYTYSIEGTYNKFSERVNNAHLVKEILINSLKKKLFLMEKL